MVGFFAAPLQQKEKLATWTKPLGGEVCSYVALKEETEILASIIIWLNYSLGFFKRAMWFFEQSY